MIIKNHVIAGFNRGAKTYDQAAGLQAIIAQKLAEKIQDQPTQHILEIGCGTGLFSQYLLQKFPAANLYLTDIAHAMVEQCRQRFAGAEQIKLLCVDGEALGDLPMFDLIASSMTLHWFSHFQNGIKNILARLRPQGRFLCAMLTENSLQEWRAMCKSFDATFATPDFPAAHDLAEWFPDMQWHVEATQITYDNLQTFLTTLKSLGAIAARADYAQLSPGKLRSMMRHFHASVTMTYEVVYGEYQAK